MLKPILTMIKEEFIYKRSPKTISLEADLVIVGGGLTGTCAAITAARTGMKVIVVQDRPVLGGNASSEVRLWVLGATSHMGNNNRWAREGGVINEIMLENIHRNPDGNPLIFDTVLLEKVVEEKNITLLLNTAVFDLDKSTADTISAVHAFAARIVRNIKSALPYSAMLPVMESWPFWLVQHFVWVKNLRKSLVKNSHLIKRMVNYLGIRCIFIRKM